MATAIFLQTSPSFLPPIAPTPNPILHHHRLHRRSSRSNKIPRIPFCSSFRNRSFNTNNNSGPPAETECPIPFEQQPINEYQNLSTSFPFSWASGDLVEYCSGLIATGASFALFVGLPVASFGVFGAQSDPLKQSLYAISGGFLVVTLVVVRMYLGWAYVGNRLLSATVEYEETGWYDGQIWVKTAEVLARDRLLGSFSVKPMLSRLKLTLVSLAASILACVLVILYIDGGQIQEAENRVIRGVYNDDSARSFEPDAFCDEPGPPQ